MQYFTFPVPLPYLPLPPPSIPPSNSFPPANSSVKTWLDDVDCSGFDTTLLSCSHNDIGDEDCSHIEDQAIVCSTSESSKNNI